MTKTFGCIALLISAAVMDSPAMAKERNDVNYRNARVEYNAPVHHVTRNQHAEHYVVDHDRGRHWRRF